MGQSTIAFLKRVRPYSLLGDEAFIRQHQSPPALAGGSSGKAFQGCVAQIILFGVECVDLTLFVSPLFTCGGKLKFIAVIEQPDVIEKILKHLGLDPQPPPIASARRVELGELFEAA